MSALTATADDTAFVHAIIAAPDDDAPRLVYADYLHERGEEARAEFIRVQVELARINFPTVAEIIGNPSVMERYRMCRGQEVFPCHPEACGKCRSCAEWLKDRKAHHALRERERGLFNRLATRQAFDIGWPPGTPALAVQLNDTAVEWAGEREKVRLVIRRGFIERVECSVAAFVGGRCETCEGRGRFGIERRGGEGGPQRRYVQAPPEPHDCPSCSGTGTRPGLAGRLFAAQPVTAVRLVDREPEHVDREPGFNCYHWLCENREAEEYIPPALWSDCLRGWFSTADAAHAALSRAACLYGRAKAGLVEIK